MVQARDELFVKLAFRQGLFSKAEALQFIEQYRAHGAVGEGIGHWFVTEGILTDEQAGGIRSAIAQRAEGHVADKRRRVPKRGAGAGRGVPQPRAGARGHHPVVHHQHGPPSKIRVSGGQQALFIGSGVIAVVLLIFLVFQFQKDVKPLGDIGKDKSSEETGKDESAEDVAGRLTGEGQPDPVIPVTPTWTAQEVERMKGRVEDAVALARNHMGDGRPGRGIETIRKRAAELGDSLPPEVQTLVDTEIAELEEVVELAYAEALAELKDAKAKGDEEAVENALFEIEDSCGPTYVERAKKEIE